MDLVKGCKRKRLMENMWVKSGMVFQTDRETYFSDGYSVGEFKEEYEWTGKSHLV